MIPYTNDRMRALWECMSWRERRDAVREWFAMAEDGSMLGADAELDAYAGWYRVRSVDRALIAFEVLM